MDKERFDELFGDPKTYKIGPIGGFVLRDEYAEIAVLFFFKHINLINGLDPEKRIHLSVSRFANLKEVPTTILKDNITILANADVYEYALTYNLSIDTEHRTIEVKMIDKPDIGESFVTQEEIEGVKASY